MDRPHTHKKVAIIGGGPAGLIAAEMLSAKGIAVAVYERKPSVGRKLLMAGRGGLNLTHSEPFERFIGRYGSRADILRPVLEGFPPDALRAWCEGLGEKTFVGTSGRVFPEGFKASPLLRAWLARLEGQGVRFFLNHDWQGWDGETLVFETPEGRITVAPDATLLALGGASWPRLGSDGSWIGILQGRGVKIAPFAPSNCGFIVDWSDIFSRKYAGQPLKPVIVTFKNYSVQGEMVITERGVEGGAIYALSSRIRDDMQKDGSALLHLDLKPGVDETALGARLERPRGRESFTNHLRKAAHLSPLAIGLLMERPDRQALGGYWPADLARLIKAYPLCLRAPFSLERAISSAGGLSFDSLDRNLMLCSVPGTFAAGEMLDWEAPTGGYLLQANFATGAHAARGIMSYLS